MRGGEEGREKTRRILVLSPFSLPSFETGPFASCFAAGESKLENELL